MGSDVHSWDFSNVILLTSLITAVITPIVTPSQAQQMVLYVHPAANMTCPGQPCMTLDEYAREPERYFASNALFFFVYGNHTLSTSLVLTDITEITFQGQILPNDDSIGTKIICLPSGNIMTALTFLHVTNILIEDLIMHSCSVTFSFSNSAVLRDTGFITNVNSSLLTIEHSHLSIRNGFFSNGSTFSGGGVHISHSNVSFSGENIFLANTAGARGGGIYAVNSSMEFLGTTTFEDNRANSGGAISCSETRTSFNGTTIFMNNHASSEDCTMTAPPSGGAVFLDSSSLSMSGTTSVFDSNSVSISSGSNGSGDLAGRDGDRGSGGAITAINGSMLTIKNHAGFIRNRAGTGGSVFLEHSHIDISAAALYLGNMAEMGRGGAFFLSTNSSAVFTGNSTFLGNMAAGGGGAIAMQSTLTVTIAGVEFLHNTVPSGQSGGAVHLQSCKIGVMISYSNFTTNVAGTSGGGLFSNDSQLVVGESVFIVSNIAGTGGGLNVLRSSVEFTGVSHIADNRADLFGSGALQATDSVVLISAHSTFSNNTGISGGGVHAAAGSRVEVSDVTVFRDNRGRYQGGAMHVTSQSSVILRGNASFSGNSAREGGAIAIDNGARLLLASPLQARLVSNQAQLHGGGIFHSDEFSLSNCTGVTDPNEAKTIATCFLEISGSLLDVELDFIENTANRAGSVLYGGNLDSCFITLQDGQKSFSKIATNQSLELFRTLSSISVSSSDNITSLISSDPLEVCFCDENKLPNCSNLVHEVEAYPGQLISLPAVVVGQGEGSIPANVVAETGDNVSFCTIQEQEVQYIGKVCTSLEYRVCSVSDWVTLGVYPEGPCGDVGMGSRDIQVTLLPCPDGFNLSVSHGCVCEDRLMQADVMCDIDTQEFELRGHRLWIAASRGNNGTYLGVLISNDCPRAYCLPPPINVSLEQPDYQCLDNHSGILCGACKDGHSLTFGTLRCLKCSSSYLALLLPFALAGMLLVGMLFALQLTVTEGTMNGLIFFANLVQINKDVLLPPQTTSVLTVFIAWLNLDLGIESCFYDGMDAYVHTWLQFVFPLYLLFLVGITLLISRLSHKAASHFFAPERVVAVLATVLLLSYTKILRNIAVILSSSKVEFPAASVLVWGVDGNRGFFTEWRHILLGTVALLLLTVLFIFSIIMLFSGVITHKMNCKKRFLLRFKLVNDAYFAPFRNSSFSWTGLLLLIRFILILSVIISSNSTSLYILLTVLILVSLLFLVPSLLGDQRLYKTRSNEILEKSFLVNIILFAGATLYAQTSNENGAGQEIISGVFLGIAFVEFLAVMTYHIHVQFICDKTSAVRKLLQRLLLKRKSKRSGFNSRKSGECGINNGSNGEAESSFIGGFVVLRKPLLES